MICLFKIVTWMESHSMQPFMSDFSHSVECIWDSSMSICESTACSFSMLIASPCMDVPQLVLPLTSWWMFRLVPVWGNYEFEKKKAHVGFSRVVRNYPSNFSWANNWGQDHGVKWNVFNFGRNCQATYKVILPFVSAPKIIIIIIIIINKCVSVSVLCLDQHLVL